MVTLTKAVLAAGFVVGAGPASTVSAATLGPAPEGNTVSSSVAVAAVFATDVAVRITRVLLVTLAGAL